MNSFYTHQDPNNVNSVSNGGLGDEVTLNFTQPLLLNTPTEGFVNANIPNLPFKDYLPSGEEIILSKGEPAMFGQQAIFEVAPIKWYLTDQSGSYSSGRYSAVSEYAFFTGTKYHLASDEQSGIQFFFDEMVQRLNEVIAVTSGITLINGYVGVDNVEQGDLDAIFLLSPIPTDFAILTGAPVFQIAQSLIPPGFENAENSSYATISMLSQFDNKFACGAEYRDEMFPDGVGFDVTIDYPQTLSILPFACSMAIEFDLDGTYRPASFEEAVDVTPGIRRDGNNYYISTAEGLNRLFRVCRIVWEC